MTRIFKTETRLDSDLCQLHCRERAHSLRSEYIAQTVKRLFRASPRKLSGAQINLPFP
jgi:hypothetical protein